MTELMKRYEAETGHNAFLTYGITQAICYPTYVEWLEEQLSNQTVEKFQEILRSQCDEILASQAKVVELEKENDRLRGIVHNLDHTLITNGVWRKV